jgi:hypothetical protein
LCGVNARPEEQSKNRDGTKATHGFNFILNLTKAPAAANETYRQPSVQFYLFFRGLKFNLRAANGLEIVQHAATR